MHKKTKKAVAIFLSLLLFLLAFPLNIFGEFELIYNEETEETQEKYYTEEKQENSEETYEAPKKDTQKIYETYAQEAIFTQNTSSDYFILLTNRQNNWDGLTILESYINFQAGDEVFISGSSEIPTSWAAAVLNANPAGHEVIAQGHGLDNYNWHGGNFVFATNIQDLPSYAVEFNINPTLITSGIRIQAAGSGENLNLRIYEIIVLRNGQTIFNLSNYLKNSAIESIEEISALSPSGATATIIRSGNIQEEENRSIVFNLAEWLAENGHTPGTTLPWNDTTQVRNAGSALNVLAGGAISITARNADWAGMDVRLALYPNDRIIIDGVVPGGGIRLQRLPSYNTMDTQNTNSTFTLVHYVSDEDSIGSEGFRLNTAAGNETIIINRIIIERLDDSEQIEVPPVEIPPVDLPRLDTTYLGSYVLRTYLAQGVQWDGLRIPRAAFENSLTEDGLYTFSIDISSPRSPQGVGIMVQTNGQWHHFITTPNYAPNEEIFFSRFTSAPANIRNLTFTEVQIVKLGAGNGGIFPESRTLFFIDNLTITNSSGEIVWIRDFEDRSTSGINISAPAGSYFEVVPTQSAFTAELPVQIVNYWDLTLPSLLDALGEYFLIGNVWPTRAPQMMNQNTEEFFLRNFNAITAEDAHKPDVIAPNPNPETWNFDYAETIVNWANENNIAMVGHTLVWHSQSPLWMTGRDGHTTLPLVTRDVAKTNMQTFIREYAGRFSGRIYSWDVLNEVFVDFISGPVWEANPNWRAHMRREGVGLNNLNYLRWYDAFANGATGDESGSDFVFYSFYFARRYDPLAILYYNDFNEEAPGKREAIAQMVEEINERWRNHPSYDGRLLIERIGMQSHHHLDQWPTNFDNIRPAIMRFIETGAGISITELDITIGTNNVGGVQIPNQPSNLTQAEQQRLAAAYARVLSYYLEFADYIYRLSIWGLTDAQSWRAWGNPLLFDADLNPKDAFFAVINATPNVPNGSGDNNNRPPNNRPPLIIWEYVYYYEDEDGNLQITTADDIAEQAWTQTATPRIVRIRREIDLTTLSNTHLYLLLRRGTITEEQFNLAMRSRIGRFFLTNS
ncbi:MAG: endo-1,4-beta-xylanase [Defluviitaleaceae bacterium]|nr:endo-1,4-beta-xylanase [Defluviitaleaceae bacterium]